MTFDPRVVLGRPDLASRTLEGILPAAAYADPRPMACIRPSASLRRDPDPAAEQVDRLAFGERFEVLEERGGYAWGQARRDGYVGFVERAAIAPGGPPPTHRVSALAAYAFARPDVKAAAFGPLPINALVAVEAREGGFALASGAGWIAEVQLAPIGMFETDPASVAERHVGAPYLWGGRDIGGVDCSGLVQLALMACGRACPRDSDQQEAIGAPVDQPARGDLAFWAGHVAMFLDGGRIVHANAYHMAVAVEPFAEAVARIAASGGGRVTSIRRL